VRRLTKDLSYSEISQWRRPRIAALAGAGASLLATPRHKHLVPKNIAAIKDLRQHPHSVP